MVLASWQRTPTNSLASHRLWAFFALFSAKVQQLLATIFNTPVQAVQGLAQLQQQS